MARSIACADLRASTIVRLLEKTDALRRPERFGQLLEACRCDYNGRGGWQDRDDISPPIFLQALAAVNAVAASEIARHCADKARNIPSAFTRPGVGAVTQALNKPGDEPEESVTGVAWSRRESDRRDRASAAQMSPGNCPKRMKRARCGVINAKQENCQEQGQYPLQHAPDIPV